MNFNTIYEEPVAYIAPHISTLKVMLGDDVVVEYRRCSERMFESREGVIKLDLVVDEELRKYSDKGYLVVLDTGVAAGQLSLF